MDQATFVTLLNEDLQTEYRSIVQYVQHIAAARGAEFRSLVEELRTHVTQELDHALALAGQIDFLGGRPTVAVPEIPDVIDTEAALRADLELEEHQLERYRERVHQAEELGLRDVAEVLTPILEQTQDHVHELQRSLTVDATSRDT